MANTYLSRTLAGSDTDKWTWSAWVKKHSNGSILPLFHADDGSSNYYTHISFHDTDSLFFQNRFANTNKGYKITTQLFRDLNAWYHVQFVWDSDNSTADDRQIIYVNGERITAYDTNIAVTADQNTTINDGYEHRIGRGGTGFNGSAYANVTLSHVHFADGQALAPTVFGETDTTTGQWKIKTSPSFTLGTNGFSILKDGNTITDQSTNSNNFTLGGGTLTQTEDCPSNVFATMNPVIRSSTGTFASGNNKFTTSGGAWGSGFATLGMFNGQGKYYMEFKGASGTKIGYGISDFKSSGVIQRTEAGENRYCGEYANSYAYHYGGNFYYSGSSTGTGYDSFTSSNVIGMAVDMDNLKIYFHKDGVYQDSKNPASNNGYTIVAPEGAYLPTICVENAGAAANFGNGIFDTTAISSEGTNASGNGKFEYDVPTGYTALSTKGLNE